MENIILIIKKVFKADDGKSRCMNSYSESERVKADKRTYIEGHPGADCLNTFVIRAKRIPPLQGA